METAREVVKNYVDTGKASVIFVDFPLLQLHGYTALISSEAAHCAQEQGKFWQMHDLLFEQQDTLAAVDPSDQDAARAAAVKLARSIGLDADQMKVCLDSQKYRPIIAALEKDATDHGIQVTPTLLVGQTPVQGAVSYQELKPILDRELSRALGTPVFDTPTPKTTP